MIHSTRNDSRQDLNGLEVNNTTSSHSSDVSEEEVRYRLRQATANGVTSQMVRLAAGSVPL